MSSLCSNNSYDDVVVVFSCVLCSNAFLPYCTLLPTRAADELRTFRPKQLKKFKTTDSQLPGDRECKTIIF